MFLAVARCIAAYKMAGFATPLPTSSITPFWTGVFLSVTNPLHIPFWLGWSTVLMNKKILQASSRQYNWYVTGIGIGTIVGFTAFIYTGNFFVIEIRRHETLLNYAIGAFILITGILQLKKIMQAPVLEQYKKIIKSL